MKIFLLNGPPRAGKDLTGQMLAQMLPGKNRILKFANTLKVATHTVAAILKGAPAIQAPEHYEESKDDNHEDFFGAKPRDAYIALSEDYCKKVFGDRVFGHALSGQLKKLCELEEGPPDNVIITDSGFAGEAKVLVEDFPDAEFHLVRLVRDFCDFNSDSRSYLCSSDVGLSGMSHEIMNPGTLGELRVKVAQYLLTLEKEAPDGR